MLFSHKYFTSAKPYKLRLNHILYLLTHPSFPLMAFTCCPGSHPHVGCPREARVSHTQAEALAPALSHLLPHSASSIGKNLLVWLPEMEDVLIHIHNIL